ncbi:MAG TPA: HIT domain-containing protein [Candidatus Limnocylindria bacterium]|nr:HIT domain-containing protein [Candidatus Limnocylindria bacterium]
METLHAPWRISYILGPKSPVNDQSLFTRIGQSDQDEANYVIARRKSCYALLNAYPYNAGHVMVVPYKQVADFDGLTEEELLELMLLLRECQAAIRVVMRPHGFNVGVNLGTVAGAGIVEHLHVHIVPRWSGDVNFMPMIGATAVIPEALLDTAAKLRAAMARTQ